MVNQVPLQGILISQANDVGFNGKLEGPRYSLSPRYGLSLFLYRGIKFLVGDPEPDNLCMSKAHMSIVVGAAQRDEFVDLIRRKASEWSRGDFDEGDLVLSKSARETIESQILSFLEEATQGKLRRLGGRRHRGAAFYGPPGNGKTKTCQRLAQICYDKGWLFSRVSVSALRAAQQGPNAAEDVQNLFRFHTVGSGYPCGSGDDEGGVDCQPGIIVFDDLDMVLRKRDNGYIDDQICFLSAMDGIYENRGVVYIVTTNLNVDEIDGAFLRPGRFGTAIHFPNPDRDMILELVSTWKPEVRESIDIEKMIDFFDGMSFAEINEVRDLAILKHIDTGEWDWDWALQEFLSSRQQRRNMPRVGFIPS